MSSSPIEFQTYAFGKRYAWYALFLLMLVGAFNLMAEHFHVAEVGHGDHSLASRCPIYCLTPL
jgi:hypothetical protein